MTLDEICAGQKESRRLFDLLATAVGDIGQVEVRVSASQVAFARRHIFARVWMPDRYRGPGHAPLVLTFSFRHQDKSLRWKQVVDPHPDRHTHHPELHTPDEIDDRVCGWRRPATLAAA